MAGKTVCLQQICHFVWFYDRFLLWSTLYCSSRSCLMLVIQTCFWCRQGKFRKLMLVVEEKILKHLQSPNLSLLIFVFLYSNILKPKTAWLSNFIKRTSTPLWWDLHKHYGAVRWWTMRKTSRDFQLLQRLLLSRYNKVWNLCETMSSKL